MTIVTDIKNIYTTHYKDCTKTGCIQKTVIIRGQEGKKIHITSVGCSLAAEAGITATSWVTLDGHAVPLATWEEKKTGYQSKSKAVDIKKESDAVLRWRLKTSGSNQALMKLCTYTYSYEDVVMVDPVEPPVIEEPPVEEEKPVETPAHIQIICINGTDAKNLAEDLQGHIGERVMEIYLRA